MKKTKTKRKPARRYRAPRTYEVPRFKFVEHRTVQSILLSYITPPGTPKESLKGVRFGVGGTGGTTRDGCSHDDLTVDEMVKMLASHGKWAFAETFAKPPVIHYWTDGKRTEEELVRFFGHEMGHCVGEKLKSGWEEENRADDYGFVATQAVTQARKVVSG